MLKILVTGLAVATVLHSADSDACSCLAQSGIYSSQPADAADNVPTDVVPWATAQSAVTLIDSEGQVVPTENLQVGSQGCSGNWELVPEAPLTPNTTYSLVTEDDGTSMYPAAVSFTTGDGPLGDLQPETPNVKIASFDATNFLNTCVYSPFQACVLSDYSGLIEVRVLDGDQEFSRTVVPFSTSKNIELGELAQACVEVRARAINGAVSEPVVHCASLESREKLEGESAGVYVSCESPQVQALLQEPENTPDTTGKNEPELIAGSISPDSPDDPPQGQGCSLSSGGTATPPWFLLAGLLALCRRRPRVSSSAHAPAGVG